MRKYIIIGIIIGIGIISLGFFINKYINNNQSHKIHLIENNIALLSNNNSYSIKITGTGRQYEDTVVFQQTLTSVSNNEEILRQSELGGIYNSNNNILESLIVESLSGSNNLDHAYLVFIDDMISSKLGSNLLESGWILGDKKETTSLLTHKYERTITRVDTTGSSQNISFSYKLNCGIGQYFSPTKRCSVVGDFSVSTPLSSGPILGKIQGQFSTSVLQ